MTKIIINMNIYYQYITLSLYKSSLPCTLVLKLSKNGYDLSEIPDMNTIWRKNNEVWSSYVHAPYGDTYTCIIKF